MKLSRSIEYAFVALSYIVRSTEQGPVLARTIAQEHGMPREYLFKILKSLVRADILSSTRGPHGGYYLAKPATSVSLLDIIEAVEGPVADPVAFSCQNTGGIFFERLGQSLHQASKAQANRLAQTSLASLVNAPDGNGVSVVGPGAGANNGQANALS